MELFLAWETLRVLYNVVLALEVVVLWAMFRRGTPRFVRGLIPRGHMANALFGLGFTVNSYLRLLGMRHWAVTALLFLAGLCLSMLLAFASVMFPHGWFD